MGLPRKEFTTKSGLVLPLLNLKGKEYLLASHRILWLVSENDRFTIESSFLILDDEKACCKSTITIFNDDGTVKRKVDGIKTEHKKHFEDFAEKATTGSISRAASYIGYGTNFSGDELNELVNEKGEEVNRIVDAPLASPETKTTEFKSSVGFKPTKSKEVDNGWK